MNEQNQLLLKRADLGCILVITHKCKEFDWYFVARTNIKKGEGWIPSLGRSKNPHDIFAKLDGAIEIAVQSKKSKADALVKWLTKNGIEKIQEEHQQVTTDRDDQLPAFQYNKVALQAQREVYQAQLHRYQNQMHDLLINRRVPHARNPGKGNIIVGKHTTSANDSYHDLPYYVHRIQQHKNDVKLRSLN